MDYFDLNTFVFGYRDRREKIRISRDDHGSLNQCLRGQPHQVHGQKDVHTLLRVLPSVACLVPIALAATLANVEARKLPQCGEKGLTPGESLRFLWCRGITLIGRCVIVIRADMLMCFAQFYAELVVGDLNPAMMIPQYVVEICSVDEDRNPH